MSNCVEELAQEILGHLKDGKTAEDIARMYRHEDADLVGEAMTEARFQQSLDKLGLSEHKSDWT